MITSAAGITTASAGWRSSISPVTITAMDAVACTNAATNTAAVGYTLVRESSEVDPTCSLVDAVAVIVNVEVDVVAVDTCSAACSAHATLDPMDSNLVS